MLRNVPAILGGLVPCDGYQRGSPPPRTASPHASRRWRSGDRTVVVPSPTRAASVPPLPLTWSFASHRAQWLPLRQLACTAIVRLGGMPDARLWRGSGRTRYRGPGRGSRFASQPAGRACPLPSAPDSVPALIDTSETMVGGTST
jgi:hypothetical protein